MGIEPDFLERIEAIGYEQGLFPGAAVAILGDCEFHTTWASGNNHEDLIYFQKKYDLSRVDTLDIAGDPTIRLDLQGPTPRDLISTYDMVIDAGTLYCCFDVSAVLAVILDILKDKGLVLHQAALTGYFGRGYFNLHPSLFKDFYEQNSFVICNMEVRAFKPLSLVGRVLFKLSRLLGGSIRGYRSIGTDALYLKSAGLTHMSFTGAAVEAPQRLPNEATLLCAARRVARVPFVRPIPPYYLNYANARLTGAAVRKIMPQVAPDLK